MATNFANYDVRTRDPSRDVEDLLIEKPPLGVRIGDPSATSRRREHLFYAAVKQGGAVAAIAYLFFFPTGWVEWTGFALFYVLNILSMSIGYHRYFTHRAFETSRPMRYVFAAWAQFGVYGSLLRWVADHRRHHAMSDKPGDIHSPYFDGHGRALVGRKGLKHAHLAWAYDDCMTDMEVYGKGVVDDPAILWAHKTRYLWFAVSVLVLPALWGFALGGAEAVIGTVMIAGFLRVALALHAIAAVNSFGHKFGSKRFEGQGEARNNWFLGLVTLGEGWHNNHHRHPRAANAGMAWYELDLSYWVLRAMQAVGLVWNVRRVKL
ncbi:MAG: acyl-CoA desaturase [Parasphingopyxis sp.]|uniref:acyl-CoA desaturase n=1 Tax=Parasphingopyxis sp. TaxID=1920299 RepID=UPI0032EB62D2